MKRFGILFLAGVILISAGCMKKRRVGISDRGNQRIISDPNEADPPGGICEGGVNLFIRPDSTSGDNNFVVGQNVRFLLNASGCRFGYAVREGAGFRRFNPGVVVNVTMPQNPESGRREEFSVVALDSQGNVHRGPYNFLSTAFNVSTSQTNLNFFPSRTISVERSSVNFFVTSNQPVLIQRVYSDEQNYISQPVSSFSLTPGQFHPVTVQLSRGAGGGAVPGKIKLDYAVNGGTQTAEIDVNHNICESSYRDDFLGNGRLQTMRFKCADGSIRVPLNLSEELVSFWQVPAGYRFRDLMHGRIDQDNNADILFFARKDNEPQKAYFFYGKSKPSASANTSGGSFSPFVLCSGAWDAPPQTIIPNQFSLAPDEENKSARVYSVQNNGIRYEASLSVGNDSCSLGAVQVAPPEIQLRVSKEEVNSGESFSVIWSASHVSGYQCKLEKKLVDSTSWETVPNTAVTPTGNTLPQRTDAQTITATTDYRAVCSKTTNGETTTDGTLPEAIKTVRVRSAPAPNPPSFDEQTLRVRAVATSWFQTNIMVSQSKSLSINASGTIRLGPNLTNVGPGGVASNRTDCKYRSATGLPGGALIGKIGPNGVPFLIGSSYTSASRSTSGNLFLGINDPKCASDNSGRFDAVIRVQR